jgi:exopolyphosphatase/guanosine-5'-triphosphate,3'-diphosphate pyrophosphatase
MTIVPRWEWRTFDGDLSPADRVLDALPEDRAQESDEWYVVSRHSDASVKLRDELVDVKQLQQVNDDGLEQWLPVLKSAFPISSDDVRAAVGALGVPVPELEAASYSLDEIRERIRANPELRVIPVHKRRRHYLVDDCMVERTEMEIDGQTTRTVVIESPDPELVSRTLRVLGLAGRANLCVARGLKRLVHFGPQRYAVIDVGTNSVKFLLGEVAASGWTALEDRSEITRLGEGLDAAGALSEAAMARTVDAVAALVADARRAGVTEIVAVGTAGLRSAPNGDEFVAAVQARCNVSVQIISGAEEGRLAYLAATASLPEVAGRNVVFDSGGGSSQFTFGHAGTVDDEFSVDVGAVRIAERFHLEEPVGPEATSSAFEALGQELSALARRDVEAVVAMGGTVTNLAAVKHALVEYDPDVVRGTVLDVAEIDRQIELYRTRSADERRSIPGLQPKRAEVILAGACIVRTILTKLGVPQCVVTDRGLRHGMFQEKFSATGVSRA